MPNVTQEHRSKRRTALKQLRSAGLLAIFALLAAAPASAQMPPGFDAAFSRNFVSGGDTGYLMMPPVLVSGPTVEEAAWSPDGQYVAIRRVNSRITARQVTAMMSSIKSASPPPVHGDMGDNELLIYSRQGKLFSVWKESLTSGGAADLGWLEGNVLIVLTATGMDDAPPVHTPLVVRVSPGRAATSSLPSSTKPLDVDYSPTLDAALITYDDDGYVIRASGADSSAKRGSVGPFEALVWSADGSEPYLEIRGQDGQKKYYGFSESELRPLEQAPALHDGRRVAQPDLPVSLAMRKTTLTLGGSQVETRALWVRVAGQKEKDYPGLVCADVTDTYAALSPTGDAVLYITADGAAMVRSLVPVDIMLVTQAREAAFRAALLHQGRQIGMAVRIFAADNDERLPAPNEFADSVGKYIKHIFEANVPWLDLFQYTYTGGSLSDIANPSVTVLGYLPGPGGFAVLYADGHTKWQSSLP
jgi:hypothetical protein